MGRENFERVSGRRATFSLRHSIDATIIELVNVLWNDDIVDGRQHFLLALRYYGIFYEIHTF